MRNIWWKNAVTQEKIKNSFELDPIKVFDGGLTAKEVFDGFMKWQIRNYPYRAADKFAVALQEIYGECTIKMARQALFKTASTISQKMKITKSAFSKIERAEDRGHITLNTLRKVAEAMECELVYAIRPKNQKIFSQVIWDSLLPEARLRTWQSVCDPKNKSGALAAVARDLLGDPNFRRRMNWSRNE